MPAEAPPLATPPAQPAGDEPFRLDLRRILIVFAVMLATLLEIIDTSIVNVALPSMMGNLGATLDEIGWVVTGYIVSNVIVIPMTGWFAARFGRKRYFTASILVFTGASLLCGLSRTLPELVFFRVVQGLGGGALLSTSQAILVETFPPRQQGLGQAIFGVGAMLGPSLGPTLGGWITDNYSWPWIFFINVPLGLLGAFLCATQLEDPPYLRGQRGVRVDWPGILFLIVGVGSLQFVLERGHRLDWFASREITVLTAAAVLGGIAFVIRELACDHPVVDLRVLRRRPLAVGCAFGSLLGLGLYGSVFLFPVYTQSLLRWTAWQSGLAILPSSIATAMIMLVVGRLVWAVGPRRLVVFGLAVFVLALLGMADWTLESGWGDIFWPQVGRGVALGAIFVPLSTATLRALPGPEVAKGAGLYNLFRQLGGSFGIALLTTLLDQRATIHRSHLVAGAGLLDPTAFHGLLGLRQWLAWRGLDEFSAGRAALAALDGRVSLEAAMVAFQDAYRMMALVYLIALPFAFAIARHAPGKAPRGAAVLSGAGELPEEA